MQIVFRYFLKQFRLGTISEVIRGLLLVGFCLILGACGFQYFEATETTPISFADGFWYSLVTMATVGYGDLYPKTFEGRFFIGMPLIIIGIGTLGYAITTLTTKLMVAHSRELKGMGECDFDGHIVLINFPSLSKILKIIDELRHDPSVGKDVKFVLIDEDLHRLPSELLKLDVVFIKGSPIRDETLDRANVNQARSALVLCKNPGDAHSDNLNITITLAIESRSRHIHTVVECIDPRTEELLRKANCDRIVCLSRFDAQFLSQELLNPGIQEVVGDLISTRTDQQLYLFPIDARFVDKTFGELFDASQKNNHLVLGLNRASKTLLNPSRALPILAGDFVVSIGAVRFDDTITAA